MRWSWSEEKNRRNKLKHGISFETAQLAFDDPLALSRPDPHPDGDRWQTLGQIGPVTVFVAHTAPETATGADDEVGRIISARKATSHERRAYEKGDY